MKSVKRNAVILTVMLFICAAVYLNWSYNKRVEDASNLDVPGAPESGGMTLGADALSAGEGDAGLYYSVSGAAGDSGTAGGDSGDAVDALDEGNTDGTAIEDSGPYGEYFAQVRLERSQARDDAAATLAAVAEVDGASAETVDGALRAMTRLAEYAVKEAELENLIRAKGFIDCVVYLTDDSVSVTVASSEGLTESNVARITDVIVTNTGRSADQLTVTEIK